MVKLMSCLRRHRNEGRSPSLQAVLLEGRNSRLGIGLLQGLRKDRVCAVRCVCVCRAAVARVCVYVRCGGVWVLAWAKVMASSCIVALMSRRKMHSRCSPSSAATVS